jgi:hypothetical protein
MKENRIHNFVFAVVDTKPTKNEDAKNAWKYEFITPFLDYLENDLDDKLPYPTESADMQPMFNYKTKLKLLSNRFNSIGIDAVLDVDAFISKLNEMRLEWTEYKKWYKESAYKLRETYYKSVLREDKGQNVSNPHHTTLDVLKQKIKNNNTF